MTNDEIHICLHCEHIDKLDNFPTKNIYIRYCPKCGMMFAIQNSCVSLKSLEEKKINNEQYVDDAKKFYNKVKKEIEQDLSILTKYLKTRQEDV